MEQFTLAKKTRERISVKENIKRMQMMFKSLRSSEMHSILRKSYYLNTRENILRFSLTSTATKKRKKKIPVKPRIHF